MIGRGGQMHWSQLKVGILVIAALAILAVMIMSLEQGLGLFATKTQYRAMVAHTQGLKVGGPVRMNGVDVGNVHQIAIAQDKPDVEITFKIQSDVASHIRKDARVSIRPMGLLGDKFLEVLPGSQTEAPLPPDSRLPGEAEGDMTNLASGAAVTMENVNSAIKEMQKILVELRQGQGTAGKLLSDPALYDRSKKVLENMESASEKGAKLLDRVEKGQGTIGQLMTDKELYTRATNAVKDLDELTQRLNDKNGTLAKLSDPTFYKRLDTLTAKGEQLLAKVENGQGTAGKLITQDELYTRADKLLGEIEELVGEVKKNPTKFFKFSVF